MTTNDEIDTEDKDELMHRRTRVKVAIIGAGASGLQCADSLLSGSNLRPEDIILLEGRDRIGGRIWTTNETRYTTQGNNNNNNTEQVEFRYDHGAAWVHGTGYDWPSPPDSNEKTTEKTQENNHTTEEKQQQQHEPDSSSWPNNPMMELLQQSTPNGQDVCLTHLKPIFPKGNPWMRPRHVVCNAGEIAFYVNGQCFDNKKNHASPHVMIRQSLDRHFELLQKVSNWGQQLYERGEGNETIHQSLQQTIEMIRDCEKENHDKDTNDDNCTDNSSIKEKETNNDNNDGQKTLVEALTPFYLHMIECWYGSTARDLQLQDFISDDVEDESYCEEGDFYGPHCTVRYGMKTILEPLLQQGVKERIFLNQQVTKIIHKDETNDNTIILETSSGKIIEAECCVITLSVGCLQKHAMDMFEPALPTSKVDAIHSFKIGVYKKVFLTFDRIFWSKKEAFLGMVCTNNHSQGKDENVTNPLGKYLLFDNLWTRDDIPCLEAILFGDSGTWAIGKSDGVIRNAVLDFIQQAIFGGQQQDDDKNIIQEWCMDCHVTRWEEDPFSLGAYTSYPLGTQSKDTEALQQTEWDGRLIFAGEATISEYEGSVHAALQSGTIAANRVEQIISCPNEN